MNVITILVDSLNRHCLGPYGNTDVRTPALDRFAEKAVVFDSHFIGAAPCMPARRELMTGRKELFWRPWGPLEPFDRPLAQEAGKSGAVTCMVTDHYHYWEYPAHGYFEFFNSVKMIRGHELDMWNTDPVPELPSWARAIDRHRPGWGTRYYRNVQDFETEEDFFSPKVLSEASDWLERNHTHDKFFLWVECFDVHEPFHVPEPYRSMYFPGEKEGLNCWPPYQEGVGHHEGFWQNTTPEEVDFIRTQYYGKVTMVDHHLEKLFAVMDRYRLWENTAVIITTDHGHELGEKRRFGKQPPHYDTCAHIPLMIWHPALKESFRVNAFTTAVDLYPTILELLDAQDCAAPHGRSLMPLVRRETDTHRDAVVYGEFGFGATVTNREYTYHCSWDENAPLYQYTGLMLWPSADATGGKFIPGVDCPVWKIPRQSGIEIPEMLFDRQADPRQDRNIASERPEIVKKMKALLTRHMQQEGVPPEQYARLGLSTPGGT